MEGYQQNVNGTPNLQQTTFFALPLETRLMIYRHYLEYNCQTTYLQIMKHRNDSEETLHPRWKDLLNLLSASPQMTNDEASIYHVFFEINTVWSESLASIESFVVWCSPQQRQAVRHLAFKVPVFNGGRDGRNGQEESRRCQELLSQLTNLTSVHILFYWALDHCPKDVPFIAGIGGLIRLRGLEQVRFIRWEGQSGNGFEIEGPRTDLLREAWTRPRTVESEEVLEEETKSLVEALDFEAWKGNYVYPCPP